MKTTIWITLLTLSSVFLFSTCSRKTQKSLDQRTPDEVMRILEFSAGERLNHFAFDLMQHMPAGDDNFVVSPFSISTALAMTYAGAREKTALEMVNTLFFDPDQERFHGEYGSYIENLREQAGENLQLNIANALWMQMDYYFLPSFLELVEKTYGSALKSVNFKGDREAIRLDINQWVYNETREKIKNLIVPGVLTEDTRMVLVNAIHFLSRWMGEFNEQRTYKDVFYGMGGQQAEADFMTRTAWYRYAEDRGLQAIEIPYSGGNFSMVVVLPDARSGIEELGKSLDAPVFKKLVEGMERTHVDLRLPKFEMETALNLERLLSEMGMPTAFSLKADFSGMTGTDSLMIDKVIHKAMIDVMETGTEAAAATAVVMITKTSIEPEPEKTILFNANRPFLFFIKDDSHNSILFMGRLGKPE